MFALSRCPSCKAFVSVQPYIDLVSDWVLCRSCGKRLHVPSVFDVALVSGTRRAETHVDQDERFYRPSRNEVQGVACQNGPQGNAHSNLLPNGKISKKPLNKPQIESKQLNLFGGEI